MAGPSFGSSDLSSTGAQGSFMCKLSVMGLQRDNFSGAVETGLGNGCPLHLDLSISDQYGIFTGVAYRQSAGYVI